MNSELKDLIEIMTGPGCNAADAGVCRFDDVADRLTGFAADRLPENPTTVITAVFPYKTAANPENIARYACLPDYHVRIGARLQEATEKLKTLFRSFCFVPFCDNSPIPEVYAAAISGLGVIGKNGLLITKTYGSWVHIGEIVTDMPVACEPVPFTPCGTGDCCIRACPSGALSSGQKKTQCISAITQKKGELTEEEAALLRKAGTVWGCDICQEICPKNKGVPCAPESFEGEITGFHAGDSIEGRAFAWRGRETIERNAKIVGN